MTQRGNLIRNPPWLLPIQQGKQPFAPTVWPFVNRGYVTRISYDGVYYLQPTSARGEE